MCSKDTGDTVVDVLARCSDDSVLSRQGLKKENEIKYA